MEAYIMNIMKDITLYKEIETRSDIWLHATFKVVYKSYKGLLTY